MNIFVFDPLSLVGVSFLSMSPELFTRMFRVYKWLYHGRKCHPLSQHPLIAHSLSVMIRTLCVNLSPSLINDEIMMDSIIHVCCADNHICSECLSAMHVLSWRYSYIIPPQLVTHILSIFYSVMFLEPQKGDIDVLFPAGVLK